jgi:hypothetical protein
MILAICIMNTGDSFLGGKAVRPWSWPFTLTNVSLYGMVLSYEQGEIYQVYVNIILV